MRFEYIDKVVKMILDIDEDEKENIRQGAIKIADCIMSGHSLFIFGASHAGILTQESFYRAGGLVVFNPIFAKELQLDNSPISITSSMERLEGYGEIIIDKSAIANGDLLIVHSVSGRNPVGIDVAIKAKEKGAYILTITNRKYSESVTSRHIGGKKLYEVSDLIIDNHGDIGDATVSVPGMEQKMGPTSTVIGATILNTLTTEAVKLLVERGVNTPPIFYSVNLDGSEAKNEIIKDKYKSQIHYAL